MKIKYIETELGNKLLKILPKEGWRLVDEYPMVFDKAIDYDFYRFRKDDQELLLEWTNWLEWEVSGSKNSVQFAEHLLKLERSEKYKENHLMEVVSIALSKTKIAAICLGSFVFLGLGIWLLSLDAETIQAQKRMNIPMVIYAVGAITVVFSVLTINYAVKKCFDSKPGLEFNEAGIIDNSSGVSAGFIPWDQITDIQIMKMASQKFLSIYVANPEKYLENGNVVQRFMHRQNVKLVGTPISISANSLKVSFDELVKIVDQQIESRIAKSSQQTA